MARSRFKRLTLLVGSFQRLLPRLRGIGVQLKGAAVGTATAREGFFRALKNGFFGISALNLLLPCTSCTIPLPFGSPPLMHYAADASNPRSGRLRMAISSG